MKENDRQGELWKPRFELRRALRQLEGEELETSTEIKTLKAELAREQETASRLRNELVSIRSSRMWLIWMAYLAARRTLLKIPFVGILLRQKTKNDET